MSTVEAPKLNYESKLPHSFGVGYVCPNEDVGIWRELIKGKRIKRAAGICSGGEVGYFALLPTVREELVLIDHNLASLYYAVAKYLLLREHGYAGVTRLLRDPDAFEEALDKITGDLPESLSKAQDALDYVGAASKRFVKATRELSCYVGGNGTSLVEHWERPGRRERAAVNTKLDKIKFVHGDFESLGEQGKFDLLYMSNAYEAGNGNVTHKDLERIGTCLNPGAYVLSSTKVREETPQPQTRAVWDFYTRSYVEKPVPRSRIAPTKPENWKLLTSIPRRDVGMTRWDYCLYQVQS